MGECVRDVDVVDYEVADEFTAHVRAKTSAGAGGGYVCASVGIKTSLETCLGRIWSGEGCIRREETPGAGDDSDGNVIALVNLAEPLPEEVVVVSTQSIELLWLIERDYRDSVFVCDGDVLF